jgi:hypothetical protein
MRKMKIHPSDNMPHRISQLLCAFGFAGAMQEYFNGRVVLRCESGRPIKYEHVLEFLLVGKNVFGFFPFGIIHQYRL